jgi:hypothetical protein
LKDKWEYKRRNTLGSILLTLDPEIHVFAGAYSLLGAISLVPHCQSEVSSHSGSGVLWRDFRVYAINENIWSPRFSYSHPRLVSLSLPSPIAIEPHSACKGWYLFYLPTLSDLWSPRWQIYLTMPTGLFWD